jgi:hypothetical protein
MTESPQWKRPSDIMKFHRKKKRISLQRLPSSDSFATEVFGDLTNSTSQTKRRNPFSKDNSDSRIEPESKRQRNSFEENPNDSKDRSFFSVLHESVFIKPYFIFNKRIFDSRISTVIVKA